MRSTIIRAINVEGNARRFAPLAAISHLAEKQLDGERPSSEGL